MPLLRGLRAGSEFDTATMPLLQHLCHKFRAPSQVLPTERIRNVGVVDPTLGVTEMTADRSRKEEVFEGHGESQHCHYDVHQGTSEVRLIVPVFARPAFPPTSVFERS